MYEPEQVKKTKARQRMNDVGIPLNMQRTVEGLLSVYWTEERRNKFNTTERDLLIDVFKNLATDQDIPFDKAEAPVEQPEGVWVEARPGSLFVRDVVRVKSNHYSSDIGETHNGRVGVIVAVRNGDIHVRYTDEKSVSGAGSVRHSPFALEKRVA